MRSAALVWAAVSRKPLEFLLVLAALTCAFTLFGLMAGMAEAEERLIALARMDRIIVNPRYRTQFGLPSAIGETLRRVPGVTGVALRTYVGGYIGDLRNGVWVDAVDEATKDVMPELPLTAAQWQHLFASPSGVFLSERIATRLGVSAGSRLRIIAPTVPRADGSESWEFEVLGVVPNEPDRNGNLVLGNYRYVEQQRVAEAQGRGYFIVAVADPAAGARIAGEIDALFANSPHTTASITLKDAQRYYTGDALGIALMTWGVSAAGLFTSLLLLGNALAQSVRDRRGEFALLKALGFREGRIAALVLWEALAPCLAGCLLGLVLAAQIERLPRAMLPGAIASRPPAILTTPVWTLAIAFAVVLALSSAAVPLWNLRRLRIAQALAPV